jgi:tRNA G10  N-methylase Trm11
VLKQDKQHELRDAVRKTINIGKKELKFEPSPYVVNGPANQIQFFKKLFELQEIPELPSSEANYVRRLALVASVDGTEIPPAQYQLERSRSILKHWNPNYGPHGWHRYIGRFPPQLIRTLINHFGVKPGEIICDPFAGSGTTLVESRLLGSKAIGIEICPLSSTISRAKSKFPTDASLIEKLLFSLTDFYHARWGDFVGTRDIKRIRHDEIIHRPTNSIPIFANYERWLIPEALLGSSIVVEFIETLDGYDKDLLTCALSSCMRSIGNVDVDVVRAEYRKSPRENVDVLKLVTRALRKMILDIENSLLTHRELISSSDDIEVIESSVLDVELPLGSIDYIITSPPYGVESVSYLRTHLLSYRCLQPILKYDPYMFNEKIIGSEYIRDLSEPEDNDDISLSSKTFTEFFKGIGPKKPSKKFIVRRNMMMGFFEDMSNLAELFSKWLKKNGKLAFVIGNKKLGKDIIPTDTIISEIFEANGLSLDEVISHKLKCNNTNSEVPWQERTIQDEFVMLFTNKK